MNIVQISTSDLAHGAGIAAYRLHKGLLESGQHSEMLVALKQSNDESVHQAKAKTKRFLVNLKYDVDWRLEYLLNTFGPQSVFSTSSNAVKKHSSILKADIINFHNIHWHRDNLSLDLIRDLSQKKKVVWTLHDMWPFTGHCIYSYGCERWKTGCGSCPELGAYVPLKVDTTSLLFDIKKRVYKQSNFVVVTPSDWLASLAKQSPLFTGTDVVSIHNGVDTSVFRATDKISVRKVLGIKPDEPVILFIASYLDDTRKGYSYFEKAMLEIKAHNSNLNMQILALGQGKVSDSLKQEFCITEMGYVSNEKFLQIIYSAADLMVFPSLIDNFPNTILECLACGTPVVGFSVGGVPEMVQHLQTGYLANPLDSEDLARGIMLLLKDSNLLNKMQRNSAQSVEENFSSTIQAKRYLDLYKSL